MKFPAIEIGRSNPKVISVYNCDGIVIMFRNKIMPFYSGSPLIAIFKIRYR